MKNKFYTIYINLIDNFFIIILIFNNLIYIYINKYK